MTLAVFPTLDGLELGSNKRADFKTTVFEALSGQESRVKLRRYPKYTFKLSMEFLVENRDEAQLTELMAFMLNRGGMHEAFLYTDPTDFAAFNEPFGIGDGVTTDFPLVRNYGGFTEPVHTVSGQPYVFPLRYDPEALPSDFPGIACVYVDGLLQVGGVDFTVLAPAVISFTAAPAVGAVLTWFGNYYYRVRFLADGYDFTQLMTDLHECKDIEFVGSVRNVV